MKNILSLIFLLIISKSLAQQLPDLPIPIGAGNIEVWDNFIFHFGGSDNFNGSTLYPRIYKFDGTEWTYHDTIPDDNVWDVVTVIHDDVVYLLGGWPSGQRRLRKYDLNTRQWSNLANSPNFSQTWGLTAEVSDGIIYLFNSSGYVFAYDIQSNSWTTKTQNTATGTWDMRSIIFNNEIYIIGWNQKRFYKYSPSMDQWTRLADSPYQFGASSLGIVNDSIFCIGGNSGGLPGATYQSILIYDISSNSWTISSMQLTSKRHWMATAEYRGGLYVIGGLDAFSNAVNIVEEIVAQGTSDINETGLITDDFYLSQNYPNPFNPSTKIRFSIPNVGSELAQTVLKVYDVLGNEVATLVNEYKSPGIYDLIFDASHLSSGVYFYQLKVGELSTNEKMILMK